MERIFPFNSKVVDKVEKIRSYKVRRSKLFYIRGLRGKAARLKEVERVDRQGVNSLPFLGPRRTPASAGVFVCGRIRSSARKARELQSSWVFLFRRLASPVSLVSSSPVESAMFTVPKESFTTPSSAGGFFSCNPPGCVCVGFDLFGHWISCVVGCAFGTR